MYDEFIINLFNFMCGLDSIRAIEMDKQEQKDKKKKEKPVKTAE